MVVGGHGAGARSAAECPNGVDCPCRIYLRGYNDAGRGGRHAGLDGAGWRRQQRQRRRRRRRRRGRRHRRRKRREREPAHALAAARAPARGWPDLLVLVLTQLVGPRAPGLGRAGQILPATSQDAMRVQNALDDVASTIWQDLGLGAGERVAVVGPGRHSSPRHRVPSYSRDECSKRVSMTWRAMSARPWPVGTDDMRMYR